MLMPDVTEIINDPEVGGGQPFQVRRVTNIRVMSGVERSEEVIDLTGNIQPQNLGIQSSTTEDQRNEAITVYAEFAFQTGSNDGHGNFIGPDEILYSGKVYRVISVNAWAEWGFSVATAARVLDMEGGVT